MSSSYSRSRWVILSRTRMTTLRGSPPVRATPDGAAMPVSAVPVTGVAVAAAGAVISLTAAWEASPIGESIGPCLRSTGLGQNSNRPSATSPTKTAVRIQVVRRLMLSVIWVPSGPWACRPPCTWPDRSGPSDQPTPGSARSVRRASESLFRHQETAGCRTRRAGLRT
jgi:hypothetical protein